MVTYVLDELTMKSQRPSLAQVYVYLRIYCQNQAGKDIPGFLVTQPATESGQVPSHSVGENGWLCQNVCYQQDP